MKNYYSLPIIAILGILYSFSSCSTYDYFNDDSVNGFKIENSNDANWVFPIAHGSTTMGETLSNTKLKDGYYSIENNNIYLNLERKNIFSFDYIKLIPENEIEFTLKTSIPEDGYPISIELSPSIAQSFNSILNNTGETKIVLPEKIKKVNSLVLSFDMEMVVENSPSDGSVTIEMDKMFDANDNKLKVSMDAKKSIHNSKVFNFENIKITDVNQKYDINAKINPKENVSIQKGGSIKVLLKFSKVKIKSFDGIIKETSYSINGEKIKLDIDVLKDIDGLVLKDSKMIVSVNHHGIQTSIKLKPQIKAVDNNNLTVAKYDSEIEKTIDKDGITEINIEKNDIGDFVKDLLSNNIVTSGEVLVATNDGSLKMTNEGKAYADFILKQPLHIGLVKYSIRDTIYDISIPNDIDKVLENFTLAIISKSDIPISIKDCQLRALDNKGNQIPDGVFAFNGLLQGNKDKKITESSISLQISKKQIEVLKKAKRIVFEGNISTTNKEVVKILADQILNISVVIKTN